MQQESSTLEKFLICIDPDSHQIYTMGLTTFTINIEKEVPPNIKEKARNALKQLAYLRDGSKFKWWFRSDRATSYRRRKLPYYLLHPDCKLFPTFENHSTFSLAFRDIHSVELVIDLSYYSHTFCDESDNIVKEAPLSLTINAGLVTGADEVIGNVVRYFYKEHAIKLIPLKRNYKFILKVSGFREYFMGSTPMLYYERVRDTLRGVKQIQVILTEIESNTACKNFPPLIERDLNDIKTGYIAPINWAQFTETPLVFWYPPEELPALKASKDYIYNKSDALSNLHPKLMNVEYPHYLIHTPDFIAKPIKENKNVPWFSKDISYSGEIDLPFRVRILGIENLSMIYDQEEEGATENGFITPHYVTKKPTNAQEGEHAHVKKKKDSNQKTEHMVIPKLAKTKKEIDYNLNEETIYHNNHGHMGGVFLSLAKDQGLSFVPYTISVECSLYHGNNLLHSKSVSETKPMPFSFSPRWFEWLSFEGIQYSNLPRETRLCINIRTYSPTGESMIIASACHNVFDFTGRMKDGVIVLNLWPFYQIDSRLGSMNDFWQIMGKVLPPNKESDAIAYRNNEYARLTIQLDNFQMPFYWRLRGRRLEEQKRGEDSSSKFLIDQPLLKRVPTTNELALLQVLLKRDPLTWDFEPHERETLIVCRNHYKKISNALPLFLSAINWADPKQVFEAHSMLKVWEPMAPESAICLLDARYADLQVRLYAVERLTELSDDALALYLIQLIQALVYETYHWSPLGELLLERGLANPYVIGQQLFWLLRSQLHLKPSYERYVLLLEQFIMLGGTFRQELADEVAANHLIMNVAEEVSRVDKMVRLEICQQKLANLKNLLPTEFCVSLDPRMRVTEFIAETCKIMDSKKLPLWLNARNAQQDAPKVSYMFKMGDDLRQDLLTLQLLRIMDKIWLDNGLDLRLKPYKVIATADQVGMIEVVLDSETTSSIHKDYGGKLGALDKNTFMNYLRKYNPEKEAMEEALENFIRSCAGYCVATYVMGIGDRHSGNIMVTKRGHLFHIDFGHFLGNFKKKLGFNRERTPFVFTEEMAHVMGGKKSENFERFMQFCTDAYNMVRKEGNHLISLFILMLSAGMPELSGHDDINYLKTQLSLHLSEQEAINKFRLEIRNTLNNTLRRIDNLIHNIKRAG